MGLPSVSIGKGNALAPSVGGHPWYDPGGLFGKKGGAPFASGGADEKAYATQDFWDIFHRAPTEDELAQIVPIYYGADQHTPNKVQGRAYVASLFQQQENTPEAIYKKQQAQYQTDAPKFADKVNAAFQANMGRDATESEKAHFGALMAGGQDNYQVEQALQQTTEYNTKQTQDFTKNLGTQLQATNADYFSKYLLPAIQSQNAQAGRSQDSSGYQAQVVNAGQQQNYDLQNYLAQVAATGYQGSVNNNAENYKGLLSQQYGLQNAGVNNTLANNAANTQYGQNLNMYKMQQDAYNNYLSRYGKREGNQGTGALLGGVAGGVLGGIYGGPMGATAGYTVGSGIGGAAGSYF